MYRCTSVASRRRILRLAFQRAKLYSNEGQQPDVFSANQYCLLLDMKGRRSMIKLESGKTFHTGLGVVDHNTIIGSQTGSIVESRRRSKFRVFWPSLDEYVVLMKRVTAPAYPKDVAAILTMMDIGPGSRIIEAGSGSGAMTLFLSRAVCPGGHVFSFDVNRSHQETAQRNYRHWLEHVRVTKGAASGWEHNVTFILADVTDRAVITELGQVHAVALDIQFPQNVLSNLVHFLLPSGVIAVYLPNITQMVEMVRNIHQEETPLFVESIIEVVHRSWEVSVRPCPSKAPEGHSLPGNYYLQPNKEREEGEEESGQEPGCGATPTVCIARPRHRQEPHTAFIAKLRKVN